MYDHIGPCCNQGNIGAGGSFVSSSNQFVYSAVLGAFTMRAWGVTIQVDCTTIAPVFNMFWRPTIGSDTGRILFSSLQRPLGDWVRGNHIYQEANRRVNVGEELLAVLSTGTGSTGFGMLSVFMEPTWGLEGNIQTQKRLFLF